MNQWIKVLDIKSVIEKGREFCFNPTQNPPQNALVAPEERTSLFWSAAGTIQTNNFCWKYCIRMNQWINESMNQWIKVLDVTCLKCAEMKCICSVMPSICLFASLVSHKSWPKLPPRSHPWYWGSYQCINESMNTHSTTSQIQNINIHENHA